MYGDSGTDKNYILSLNFQTLSFMLYRKKPRRSSERLMSCKLFVVCLGEHHAIVRSACFIDKLWHGNLFKVFFVWVLHSIQGKMFILQDTRKYNPEWKTHEIPTIMFLHVSRLLQVVIALGSLVYWGRYLLFCIGWILLYLVRFCSFLYIKYRRHFEKKG